MQLTTASSQKHKRQTGVFSGAIFKLTQAHSSLTTLSLMENAFSGAPSFASCSSKGAHAAALLRFALAEEDEQQRMLGIEQPEPEVAAVGAR